MKRMIIVIASVLVACSPTEPRSTRIGEFSEDIWPTAFTALPGRVVVADLSFRGGCRGDDWRVTSDQSNNVVSITAYYDWAPTPDRCASGHRHIGVYFGESDIDSLRFVVTSGSAGTPALDTIIHFPG